jgi:ubiquinol-cytochrome c reductase iron-sulfur subunit
MVGSLGVLAASGAKSTVSDILSNMAASADVLALAKIEVEMASIPEGEFGMNGLGQRSLMT